MEDQAQHLAQHQAQHQHLAQHQHQHLAQHQHPRWISLQVLVYFVYQCFAVDL